MKRLLLVLTPTLMILGSCASQQAYQNYTDAVIRANAYRQQPGITQEFDAQGRLVKQTVIMPDQPVQVAQIKDSEWASPVSMALSLGMFGLGNWAVSHEWARAMKATQPNVTTTSGGNMAGGNVEIPTTTTTTTNTSTITNPTPTPAATE